MTVDRYAEIHRAYRWDVPARFSIAQACCGRWAHDRARFALYWEDEAGATAALTFWDVRQQANRLSNALAALGVARGDKVALILPQRPETVVAHVAINQLGAVAVPLSFLFGPEALEYRLSHSQTKVVLVDPQSLPAVAAIRERCPGVAHVVGVAGAREAGVTPWETLLARGSPHFAGPELAATDPAYLVYTSGTTGPPKGALMPQQCLIGNLPGFVHSHDGYPRTERPVLVAGRLGVDGRPHGRAPAHALLRPADRRLPRPLRPGARLRTDREVRDPEHVPVPDRAQDDDEGVPATEGTLRRRASARS